MEQSQNQLEEFPCSAERVCRILNLDCGDVRAKRVLHGSSTAEVWQLSVEVFGQPSMRLLAKTSSHSNEVFFYSSEHAHDLQEHRIIPTCYHADADLILLEDLCVDAWMPLDEKIDPNRGMPVEFVSHAAAGLGKFHLRGLLCGGTSLPVQKYFVDQVLSRYRYRWIFFGSIPPREAAPRQCSAISVLDCARVEGSTGKGCVALCVFFL